MNNVNWTLVVPIVSAITAILAAILGFIRNRRTDTITLYSTFVDDLHEEVQRLRVQYDEDRKQWDSRERELLDRIERLRGEIESLQDDVGRLRKRILDGGSPEALPPAAEKETPALSPATQSIISEIARQIQQDRGSKEQADESS